MKLEKISDYGPPKIAVYDTTVWAEATLQFNGWKEYFQNDEPVKHTVHKDYFFVSSIWARNNVRYSGIHRLNASGEIILKTGINLDNYEWINVMKKEEEINIYLYGLQAVRGEKHASVNKVQVWAYKWLLNGEPVEVKNNNIAGAYSTMQFYTEEEARKQGHFGKPDLKLKNGDELVMEVSSEFVDHPNELLQMRMILQYVAKKCADISHEMNCAACQNKPPSAGQVSHMQAVGCLYNEEFQDYGNELTDAVYSVIEPDDLIALYNIVCKKLDVLYTSSALMAKAIMAWLPSSVVADTMTEEEELLREACLEEDKMGFTEKYKDLKNPVIGPENWLLNFLIAKAYSDVNMQEYLQKKIAAKKFGK